MSAPVHAVLRVLLGSSEVAIPLEAVTEIVRMVDIGTALPGASGSMRGALNLRGEIVPVFDVAPRFHEPPVDADPAHYIVILNVGGARYGVMANDTLPVAEVPAAGIRAIAGRGDLSVARHIANLDGRLVPVLDTEGLLGR